MRLQPDELLSGQSILEWVPEETPELVHIAVAFAGRLLSDLGADVTRCLPQHDPLTSTKTVAVETVGAHSLLDTYLNRNKRAVPITSVLEHIGGVSVAMLGAPNQTLEDQVSSVIATALPRGVGLDNIAVSELGVQGLVGLTDLFGEPDDQPLMMGGHQTAYALGYSIFCAAMASLANVALQGKNDTVRVNAVDTLAWVNWKGVAAGTLGFPVVRGGRKAEAPVLKCADGYFAFLHLPNNWDDICAEVGDSRLADEMFARPGYRAKNAAALNEILADWAQGRTRAALYEFCLRCAIPGGPVLTGADLLEDSLYQHRGYIHTAKHPSEEETVEIDLPGLPITIEASSVAETGTENETSGNGMRKEAGTDRLPLAGMLVLDLGIFTAGSVTSTLLADLGARVIKIESEAYSDPFRIWPGIKGDSPLFTFNNRNKQGVNLDLKSDAGRNAFLALVAKADVVVENFRRGVLERLGIDYSTLRAANPKIVLASISGQGASGPGAGHVTFGSTLEAIGGVAALTGYKGRGCYISGRNLNYPDQIVCLYGAGAVVAAVLKAKERNVGMHIDVSQREVTSLAVGEQIAAASLFGSKDDFPGNDDVNAALQDIFRVSDGWLCVTAKSEAELETLRQFLDCDVELIESNLSAWLAAQRSEVAIERLRGMNLAVFKANTGAEAGEEVAVKSGSAFSATAAGVMVKGFPFQFDNSPMVIYGESPRMGEHTEKVLQEYGITL